MSSWYLRKWYVARFQGSEKYLLNEFQKQPCPVCGHDTFGRMTHTWTGIGFPPKSQENYHYNLKGSQEALDNMWFFNTEMASTLFPAGDEVYQVDQAALPQALQPDWGTALTTDVIRAHGTLVGREICEERT